MQILLKRKKDKDKKISLPSCKPNDDATLFREPSSFADNGSNSFGAAAFGVLEGWELAASKTKYLIFKILKHKFKLHLYGV